MLTLPDFREKKILFITPFDDGPNDLKIKNSNIALFRYEEKVNEIPCNLVQSIFIISETTLTSGLIKQAQKYGISIFLLDRSFSCYAKICSEAEGNYKLREIQYKMSDEQEMTISRSIITNKLKNQKSVLRNYERIVPKGDIVRKTEGVKNREELLGIEGSFASTYFKELFKDIGWYRRAPRTKEDIPNMLLDIGYTFLFNYIDSLLLLFGFDTYKGVYHQLFFSRKSLSCDIMEPFRPLIDKQLLNAYNLKRIDEEDFKYQNGSYQFKRGFRKKYVDIWLQAIMDNREHIYKYVQQYYRHLMYPDKYELPEFILKC